MPWSRPRRVESFGSRRWYPILGHHAALGRCNNPANHLLALLIVSMSASIGAIAALSPPGSHKVTPGGVKRPPAIEQITEHTYRVGAALVDTTERTIVCPGEINMDEGAIEYLAVAPGGKTHESLLRIDVRPLHFQLALLMLDLEPKNVLSEQGDKGIPQGDAVELRIRWRDNEGSKHIVRAEEMVMFGGSRQPMPHHDWVFTGSRIVKQGFQADLEKSLVAVWHDPAAILDNPLREGGNNAYLVDPRRTPKRGTHIELQVRAVAPMAKQPETATNKGGKR